MADSLFLRGTGKEGGGERNLERREVPGNLWLEKGRWVCLILGTAGEKGEGRGGEGGGVNARHCFTYDERGGQRERKGRRFRERKRERGGVPAPHHPPLSQKNKKRKGKGREGEIRHVL